jgi:hypothetical protein
MTTHQGASCCSWCKQIGATQNNRLYFKYEQNVTMRTDNNVEQSLHNLQQQRGENTDNNIRVDGFYGRSKLFDLDGYSFCNNQSIDAMHHVSGMWKLFVKSWSNAKNEKAYIGSNRSKLLDEIILKQKIPDLIHRNVRSVITHKSHFKVLLNIYTLILIGFRSNVLLASFQADIFPCTKLRTL